MKNFILYLDFTNNRIVCEEINEKELMEEYYGNTF
jgi:hypothetical protein